MIRRSLLVALVAGIGLTACSREAARRPDLLLVTVDTLRADALGCYGGPAAVGRALCAIGENGGTRFRWAFAPAAYTAPSIASILTSQYPFEHGVRQSAGSLLRPEAETLAEALGEAGYARAAFVSNPVLGLPHLDQGFETYDLEMSRQERNRALGEREAEATTDAALAWLERAGPGPWFLWIHYQDPHGPYAPPDPRPVEDAPGALRLSVLPNESGYGGIPAYQALPGLFTRDAYQARYHQEIRYLDGHVARLLSRVTERQPEPVVLLTADHGEAFGEDGYYFAHGHSVGLDQIRVPLLLRAGDVGLPPVVEEPVSLLDVAPTLLDLAGIDAPAGFRGTSLLKTRRAAPVFAETPRQVAVIDQGRYLAAARTPELPVARLPRIAPLEARDPLPAYVPVETPPRTHGRHLRDFLAAAAAAPPPPQQSEVPEDTRERLRALGYVE